MYCVHCGKPNVENASFCAFCGKAIGQPPEPASPKNEEWEYTFFSQVYESGKGGRWNLTFGVTEYSVRLDNWGSDQNRIMPKLQEKLDKGWQYVNPPGPNSYKFIENTDYAGSIKYKWLSVSSFVVDFRRPARPLKEQEAQMLGTWQEIYDPNHGFWNTLGNAVFSQKLSVNKYKYEFRKDHTFHRYNRDGEEMDGGIFYESEQGLINLFYKYSPDENKSVTLTGNKLILNGKRVQVEFERINPSL